MSTQQKRIDFASSLCPIVVDGVDTVTNMRFNDFVCQIHIYSIECTHVL